MQTSLIKNIGKSQHHATRTAGGLAKYDEWLLVKNCLHIPQLQLRHYSGHIPGGKELAAILIAQFKLHNHVSQKITEPICSPLTIGASSCIIRTTSDFS